MLYFSLLFALLSYNVACGTRKQVEYIWKNEFYKNGV